MFNVASGKKYLMQPHDFGGPPGFDDGRYFELLDGRPITSLKTRFELLTGEPDLPPGEYECTVNFSLNPDNRPLNRQNEAMFWSGELVSAPVHIKIIPKTSRTWKILVPTRVFVDGNGTVRMDAEYPKTVNIEMQNGMNLMTIINDGIYEGGPPDLRATSQLDFVSQLPGGKSKNYVVKVMETSPTGHLIPVGDVNWIAWTETFSVAIPK
jgi:hypothetical protein